MSDQENRAGKLKETSASVKVQRNAMAEVQILDPAAWQASTSCHLITVRKVK